MKKLFTLFLITALTSLSVFAQSPQKMSYQAVVRNSNGVLMANQAIGMKISILQGSETGTTVYVETQTTTTNANGLATIEIGGGTIVSGSFAGIDWSNGTYFIKTETDPAGGTNYTIAGTSQILSVPYSLYAKTAKTANYNDLTNKPTTLSGYGITDAVSVAGTQTISGETTFKGTTTDLEEPLFEVKNKDSQTIFAVYNEGVRIWVADGAKGTKGGFAVGGFDMIQDYLNINSDSARIYVKNPADGVSGGFAVGGFENTGGTVTPFTSLTPENYFIGHEGGQNLTTGVFNSVIGYQSGKFITTGRNNAFLGYQSGFNNNTGSGNLFLGYKTGYSNVDGNFNSFIGYLAGQSNTTGVFNTFLGSFSGYSNTIGSNNTFVGDSTGYMNISGLRNTFIGTGCGIQNNSGNDNVFIGTSAGRANTNGFNNVFIGNQTGRSNITGFSNVMIGINAGYMFDGNVGNTFIGDNSGRNTKKSDKNVFLGAFCGYNDSNFEGESSSNVFIGNRAGYNSPGGNNNVLIGFDAGYSNENSSNNVILGFKSGYSNTTGKSNVYIGSDAASWSTNGENNTIIGSNAGFNTITGNNNLFLGASSGMGNINGQQNVVLGSWAGAEGVLGDGNVLIGMDAGRGGAGSSNIYIGNGAGSIHGGDMNIFLGYGVGADQKGSGYYIVDSNSGDSTQVLLFGNFLQDLLRINGKVGIGTHPLDGANLSVNNPGDCGTVAIKGPGNPWNYSQIKLMSQEAELTKYWEIDHRKANSAFALVYHDGVSSWKENLNLNTNGLLTLGEAPVTQVLLDVRGNAQFRSVGSGTYYAPLNITSEGILTTATSDARLKTNITEIQDALTTVMSLRGIKFNWLNESEMATRIGFIAQEVECVLPEVVFTNPVDGYKGVNYAEMSALFVEALKEQQQQIESYKSENDILKSKIQTLQDKVARIEALLTVDKEQ